MAIMATAILSVIALQSVQRYNFEQGLRHYSDHNFLERLEPLAQFLAARYELFGDWRFIEGSKNFTVQRLVRSPNRQGMGNTFAPSATIDRNLIPKSVVDIISLLDANSNWVAGARYEPGGATKAITLNDQTIGYLALLPRDRLTRNLDQRFAAQQNNNRFWASLAILLGALLSAFLVSRNLGKPIKELNEQVQSLSDGNYDTQLTPNSGDELGSLARNFNKLADKLRSNRDQRRQWVSDISHELRTPISVLRAEIECVEDGLQPLDMKTISNLRSEVDRLNLLIDDLHQLSQADAGALSLNIYQNNIVEEINSALSSYQEQFSQNQIMINNSLNDLPDIDCDPARIRQVISNLLQNTLRYTDSPGELHISGEAVDKKIRLIFEDSPPGVTDDEIDKIFDRLYRVDPSRKRAANASGLGLSISASIIQAHHGTISARSSKLGGLAIKIELPLVQPKDDTTAII